MNLADSNKGFDVRAATSADLARLTDIYNYYVANAAITSTSVS